MQYQSHSIQRTTDRNARRKWGLGVIAIATSVLGLNVHAAPIPVPDAFPDASNTGINGAGLSTGELTRTGGMTVTEDGAVIENMYVEGGIKVEADDVTIRDTYVDAGSGSTGPRYGIQISGGPRNALIEDTTVVGGTSKSVYGENMTLRRVNLSGGSDALQLGKNTVIEDSYLHDMSSLPGAHNDAIQSTGGSNVVIRGNTIQGPYQEQTSAIIIQTNFRPIEDVLIEDNFLSGGAYTLYSNDRNNGYGPPRNVQVKDNVFEKNSSQFGHLSSNSLEEMSFSNNIFHTGEPIPENAGDGGSITDPEDGDGILSQGGFQTFGVDEQDDPFALKFEATPQQNDMNAVFGLLDGVAGDWDDLAAIFRFDFNGQMEVRDGDVYTNDIAAEYTAGKTYKVRMEVDPDTQTYSVYVTREDGTEIQLADDYEFRSEQSNTDMLDAWSLRHVSGGMTVEGVQVVPEPASLALFALGGSVCLFRRRRH
jgi:hypothetical protein